MSNRAAQIKRAANAANAARYPRRSKQARQQMRQRRTEQRELVWLQVMGIARDASPLVWMPKRKRTKGKR